MKIFNLTAEATAADVIHMCNSAQWTQFRIDLPSGNRVYIRPCNMGPDAPSAENVEYFLVDGALPWGGESTPETLAAALNRYEDDIREMERDRERLSAYYEEHIRGKNPDPARLDFYSDWYKDLYGRRPVLAL